MKGVLDCIASADEATLFKIEKAIAQRRKVNEFESVPVDNSIRYGIKDLRFIYQKHVSKEFDTDCVRFKGNSYEWEIYYYDYADVYIHISARPQADWHDDEKYVRASVRGKHFSYCF